MKRILFVLAVASLVAVTEAGAQNTAVARGKVVDHEGKALEGVEVVIEYLGGATQTLTTRSNAKGEYIQVGLRNGEYRLTFQKEGYLGGSIEQRLSSSSRLPEYRLVPAQAAPQPVDPLQAKAREAFDRGIELTQAGQLDEALAAFHEVIEAKPELAEGHYNIGYVMVQKQDAGGAEASFKRALELDPEHADSKLALAKLYQDTGRADAALALMNEAAETGDARVHFNRGVFNLNSGNTEEAIAAFRRAEELDPSNAETQFHLGTLAVGQGKVDEAVERLERYLQMSPQNPQNVATAEGLLQALKK